MRCGRHDADNSLCHNLLTSPIPASGRVGAHACPRTRLARTMPVWCPVSSTHCVSKEGMMSVAKVIEITADSEKGFDDAVRRGIEKAGETLDNIRAAWIANQEVLVEDNRVRTYRVHLRVTFVLG